MSNIAEYKFVCGNLAFCRSQQTSKGKFVAINSEAPDREYPVRVEQEGVRGQTSHDGAPVDKQGKSNPQTIETAHVPVECDRLELRLSVRIVPESRQPHSCDDPEVFASYKKLSNRYMEKGGYSTLALLYLWNYANGRFSWRNLKQSDHIRVSIEFRNRLIEFDPLRLSLEEPADVGELVAALTDGTKDDLITFLENFELGLTEKPFGFRVIWSAEVEELQEVFPSQEYVRDAEKATKYKGVGRVLSKVPVFYHGEVNNQATLHSQKIGAAIRHIDIWHGNENYGAIAVNPFGGIQQNSEVLRSTKTKKSLFDLRKQAGDWLREFEHEGGPNGIPGEIHFIMANLVRGGVFGKKNNQE